jgi:tryptophanase
MVEVFEEVARGAAQLRGLRITYEAPQMRHFTARFARL